MFDGSITVNVKYSLALCWRSNSYMTAGVCRGGPRSSRVLFSATESLLMHHPLGKKPKKCACTILLCFMCRAEEQWSGRPRPLLCTYGTVDITSVLRRVATTIPQPPPSRIVPHSKKAFVLATSIKRLDCCGTTTRSCVRWSSQSESTTSFGTVVDNNNNNNDDGIQQLPQLQS